MRTLKDLTYNYVILALSECGGNRTQAAEMLGISARTIRNYISHMKKDKTFLLKFQAMEREEYTDEELEKELKFIFATNEQRLDYINNPCPTRTRYEPNKSRATH